MSQSRIIVGDSLEKLKELPAGSARCCVTSPPYWGLRDYGTARWDGGSEECDHLGPPRMSDKTGLSHPELKPREQILAEPSRLVPTPYREICGKCGAHRIDSQLGLERTPEEYVAKLVAVFREVRRVLADDATVWLNLGDSYASVAGSGRQGASGMLAGGVDGYVRAVSNNQRGATQTPPGLKPKDLVGVPWSVAFALRADGWYLRSEIIWAKPNPMPESVQDRVTKSHEQIFLLAKSSSYYYDADAIREPNQEYKIPDAAPEQSVTDRSSEGPNGHQPILLRGRAARAQAYNDAGRNRRSVWTIATAPFPEAHFATFPPALVEPCILAGSAIGDTVLDPFCGAGTSGLVASRLHRNFVGVELNPKYAEMARRRIEQDAPLFNEAEVTA